MGKLLHVTDHVDSNTNAITHSGVFHADDVFSALLLSSIIKTDMNLIYFARVNEVPKNVSDNIIVFDIGHGNFDHHQKDAILRPTGRKYASFGLLWKEFGKEFLRSEFDVADDIIDLVFKLVDSNLVEGIDAVDNGEVPSREDNLQIMSVSKTISNFNPTWDSNDTTDTCFLNAIEFAQLIFKNVIENAISKAKAKKYVDEAIEKTGKSYINWIMELDRFMPWEQFLFESDNPAAEQILYVTYPSNRGGYHIKAVPDKLGSFGMRQAFPDSWAGKKDEELEKISGVEGATFCHSAKFLCAAKDKQSAKMLAYKSGSRYPL